MKEMQLFEVGFKDRFDRSGYFEKFYVAANDSSHAETLARENLENDAAKWDGDGDPKAAEQHLESVRNLHLSRLHHIGKVIV